MGRTFDLHKRERGNNRRVVVVVEVLMFFNIVHVLVLITDCHIDCLIIIAIAGNELTLNNNLTGIIMIIIMGLKSVSTSGT